MQNIFHRFSRSVAEIAGSPLAFVVALMAVICWALSGPFFNYSSEWQLIINTGTTIITFLLVVLLQNSQNHDAKALHLKLDELIRVSGPARNKMVNLETLSDGELDQMQAEFERVRSSANRRRRE